MVLGCLDSLVAILRFLFFQGSLVSLEGFGIAQCLVGYGGLAFRHLGLEGRGQTGA